MFIDGCQENCCIPLIYVSITSIRSWERVWYATNNNYFVSKGIYVSITMKYLNSINREISICIHNKMVEGKGVVYCSISADSTRG